MNMQNVLDILPMGIKEALSYRGNLDMLQEIRIRTGRPLMLEIDNKEEVLKYLPTPGDLKSLLQKMSNYSFYAYEEEIRQGYITIRGGHRVGICGTCVMDDHRVRTIKNVASVNIRICRQVTGCSEKLIPYVCDGGEFKNTIIISPPKCGKTTIIRDMARCLSDGIASEKLPGNKVCVVDERSEIAACCNGMPQLNVGMRTDVLDACLKSEGIMMAIRSMSPDVIVCDEIGTYKDMDSLLMALNCGVKLLTTIHGYGVDDFYDRAVFKELVSNKVFDRAVVLSGRLGAGTMEEIYDLNERKVLWRR